MGWGKRGRGRGRKGGTELRGTSKAEARVGLSVQPQSLPPPTRQRIHTTHVRREAGPGQERIAFLRRAVTLLPALSQAA